MGIYRNWFLACRPWSFTMTVISLSVGAGLAATDGAFSWALYLLTLCGMLALVAAANFMNDYYDVLFGVDTLDVATAQYRRIRCWKESSSLARYFLHPFFSTELEWLWVSI